MLEGYSAIYLGVVYFFLDFLKRYLYTIIDLLKIWIYQIIINGVGAVDYEIKLTRKIEEIIIMLNKEAEFNKSIILNYKKNYTPSNNGTVDVEDFFKKIQGMRIQFGNHLIYTKKYGYIYAEITFIEEYSQGSKYFSIRPKCFLISNKESYNDLVINDTLERKIINATNDLQIMTAQQTEIINFIGNYAKILYPQIAKIKNTPVSFLLHGAPGVGKSQIFGLIKDYFGVKNCITQTYKREESICYHVSFYNASLVNILSIDEIDLYYAKDPEKTIGKFHKLFDYCSDCFVIIICTTNNIDVIEKNNPALLNRFTKIIKMESLDEHSCNEFAMKYSKKYFNKPINVPFNNDTSSLRGIIREIHNSFIASQNILIDTLPDTP